MLLKDCPVGSVVRLVSICGDDVYLPSWKGQFEVFETNGEKYVIDGDNAKRYSVNSDPDFQFEIVLAPDTRTLTLSGTTYTLTPYEAPKLVTIDGVVYVMTEVK